MCPPSILCHTITNNFLKIHNSCIHQIFQNATKYKVLFMSKINVHIYNLHVYKLFNKTKFCTSLQISKIYRYKWPIKIFHNQVELKKKIKPFICIHISLNILQNKYNVQNCFQSKVNYYTLIIFLYHRYHIFTFLTGST